MTGMLELTDTTNLNSLRYTLPSLKHDVTVHLPQSSLVTSRISRESTHRIIEIPCGSHWEPGAHWHKEYVERIRIIQGSARVWIDGKVQKLQEGDETTFQLFAVHNFCRSEFDSGPALLIEEWTDNEDGNKVIFFRNAFSLVGDADKFGGFLWAFLRFLVVCSYRDNFLAFWPPQAPHWLQRTTTAMILGTIQMVGKMAGWHSWYSEYTPKNLRMLANNVESRKTV